MATPQAGQKTVPPEAMRRVKAPARRVKAVESSHLRD
ncbi:hypothetical protein QF036_004506 [Arthrobacter globiformis]|nr:hypothetical protein [Arthrobacter globiformis]